jgi:hypothetical protein
MSRKVIWTLFLGALVLTLSLKAAQLSWFAPRPPLEPDRQPALLFFNKARGCECELFVYDNAEAQMDGWDAPVQVIRIDLDRRPDLARQYQVIRAPTMILLDAAGQIVWRQDEGLSDATPLDLERVEILIENEIP